MTPIEVYIGPLGFFLTPIISKLNVHFNSGCVMWALVKRNPIGLIKRSYFGGLRVKPGPTNVTLVTSRFHCLAVIHQPGEHNKELAFAKTPAQDCEGRTVRTPMYNPTMTYIKILLGGTLSEAENILKVDNVLI